MTTPQRVNPATRTESTVTTTNVRLIVSPFGRNRENPPSLGHLRDFVEACAGLPDDLPVRIDKGALDEGGRHTVTLAVAQKREVTP